MMRKSSTTTRRRSSSNPGRFSQQDFDRNSMRMDQRRPPNVTSKNNQDSMIPKPRMRSSSSDRLSGFRKTNFKPTTGKYFFNMQNKLAICTDILLTFPFY